MKRCGTGNISELLLGLALYNQSQPNVCLPQAEMNKAMEDAMKGMSEEEKVEMRKMMKNVMPEMMVAPSSNIANYSEFTSNKQLVPTLDKARINKIPGKNCLQEDMSG